jgi:hypothetical protein
MTDGDVSMEVPGGDVFTHGGRHDGWKRLDKVGWVWREEGAGARVRKRAAVRRGRLGGAGGRGCLGPGFRPLG